jgi:hypothetical protein
MTSWAKTSATAFLTPTQIDALARDKRVSLLTENEYQDFSAGPPWGNTYVGAEHRSYGFYATNGKVGYTPASGRDVYVIDSGVAAHADLQGVVTRVNMACGTSLSDCSNGSASDLYPRVGCYPHATHVAGIISSRGNNGLAGAGIYDAVRLHSVSVLSASGAAIGKCGNSGIATTSIGYALDYVYRKTLGSPPGYLSNGVAIVNISINSGSFGYTINGSQETNRAALLKLTTPGYTYIYNTATQLYDYVYFSGAFVAQSAGNSIASPENALRYDAVGGKKSVPSTGIKSRLINLLSPIRMHFQTTTLPMRVMELWLWVPRIIRVKQPIRGELRRYH